ncbi:MAG: sigma 54-interacting transcriptional regulator [Polyangiaceae bacterium]
MALDLHGSVVSATVRSEFRPLVGESLAMRSVLAAIERIAKTDAPALILGESGTGKELAARAVHRASPRSSQTFVVVDCSRLSDSVVDAELLGHDGAFERAEHGTLLLDEVGDVPLELQPRLLHALGEQEPADVRIIASSQRDLSKDVKSGKFRADLYYRLAVIQLRMPPLRERLDDISLLARALVPQIAGERDLEVDIELDGPLIESLSRHNWPGNVRELRNCLEQLLILRSTPEMESCVPAMMSGSSAPGSGAEVFEAVQSLPFRVAKAQIIEQFERHYLARLLDSTGGNVAEAARRAGVDRVTLFRAIQRVNLQTHRT